MKKILFSFILAITILPLYSQIGSKNFIDQNYIEVSGSADMEVIPDRIYLHIALTEKDKKGKNSVEAQEKSLLKLLSELHIDTKKDLSIISFSSTYIRYFFKKNDIIKTKEYELLLRDAKNLAPVYAGLDALDIADVSIVKLDHSKIDSFKEKTKIEAIKAAKNKAELYTRAINQGIGKALLIQEMEALVMQNEVFSANTILRENKMYSFKASAMNQYPEIHLKKIHITAKVLTKFELK